MYNGPIKEFEIKTMAHLQDELVKIETGIDEQSQEGGFMNATLQSAGPKIAMSIHTTVDVPEHIAAEGEDSVAKWVKNELFHAANTSSRIRFHVQMGAVRHE